MNPFFKIFKLSCNWLGYFIFLFAVVSSSLNATHFTQRDNILLLNSYHKGFDWTDNITQGIEDVFKNKPYDIHVYYMDTKRLMNENQLFYFKEVIQERHDKHQYKIILCSDNNAFNFLNKYKDEVFPNVPIVFCGLNYPKLTELKELDNFTGLIENIDLHLNINLIQSIHPNCKRIKVITDNTTTGKKIQEEVLRVQKELNSNELEIDLLYDLTITELGTNLRNSKKDSIVLLTIFNKDKEDTFFEYHEATEYICKSSNVPVYGSWNFQIEHGIAGGYLINGYNEGTESARIALKILKGTAPNTIPIKEKSQRTLTFDYNILEKENISLERIPKEARIINKPKSFFEEYKAIIKQIFVVFSFMILTIIALLYGLARAKYVERKLKKSERKYKSLYNNAPVAIYKTDFVNRRVISANPEGVKLLGYSSEKDLIENYNTIEAHLDQNLRISLRERMIKHGSVSNIEVQIYLKDRSTIWVQLTAKLSSDNIVESTMIDISKRKKAEKDLLENQLSLKKVRQVAHLGNWEYKRDEGFTFWSDEMFEIAGEDIKRGIPSVEYLNKKIVSKDLRYLQNKIEEIYNTKQDTVIEISYEINPGELRYFKSWIKVVQNQENNTQKAVGITQDITSQKIDEKELIKAKEHAENALKAKDEFLALMSHEMRTPLNPILGFAQLLQERHPDEPDNLYLNTIINAAERQLDLIDNILVFMKLGSNSIKAEPMPFDIEQVLEQSLFEIKNQKPSLEINRETIDGFEKTTHELKINTDKRILTQILMNLLENACKYTKEGSICLLSGLKKTRKQTHLRIEVKDTGIGISEKTQELIFKPFTQADSTFTRDYEGAGLGLAICQKLINLLEGEIGLESQLGEGSLFWFEIPIKSDYSNKEELIQEESIRLDHKLTRNRNILVVEDNESNILLIKDLLIKYGAKPCIATNGNQAIDFCEKDKFDIILMDLSLPLKNGFETTQEIRSQEGINAKTPIIALTADDREETRIICLESGMQAYLTKPINSSKLFNLIQETVQID